MTRENRLDHFVPALFSRAKQAGMKNCQVYAVKGMELFASTENKEILSQVAALSFEAELNDKTISVFTSNCEDDSIDFLINSAINNAEILSKTEKKRSLYDGNGSYPQLKLRTQEADHISRLRDLVLTLTDEIYKTEKSLHQSNAFIQSISRTIRVINDKGLDVSTAHSQTFCVMNPIFKQNEDIKTSQFFQAGSCPADLDIPKLVQFASHRVASYASAKALQSGQYAAVFCNEAASHLLQSMAILFCKDQVDLGRSQFKGKLGEKVAASRVTILDDPHKANGLFTVPFDAQGVPTLQRTMIKSGNLTNLFCDLNTAEPENNLFPGCLTRSRIDLSSEISASNMYIKPGDVPESALIKQMGNGIYITEVSDYFPGHGLNLASGDFSLPCKGFMVNNGEIQQPFDNVTVSGNLYSLLQIIDELANEVAFGYPVNLIPGMPFRAGCYGSPALLVQKIDIAGI